MLLELLIKIPTTFLVSASRCCCHNAHCWKFVDGEICNLHCDSFCIQTASSVVPDNSSMHN